MMMSFRAILATCAVAVTLQATVSAQMMPMKPPVPMGVQQFSHAAIGQRVQIAVRVESVKRETLSTQFLERVTDSVARATTRRVMLFFPDGTPIVMGRASDVVPGAVLYVYGVVTAPNHVDVKRLVIDTKYVSVK